MQTVEQPVSLADCPPGLFMFGDTLGFKTEYMAMEPVGTADVPGDQIRWKVSRWPDAYVVASGEYFWGGTTKHSDRAALLVQPVARFEVPLPPSGIAEMSATPTTNAPVADREAAARPSWTCFHCGETFTTPGAARDHFGFDPSSDPACRIKVGAERGLVMALRKAEGELAEAWNAIHDESTEAARAYYAQTTRHQDQITAAEEAGYERGLADGRAALTKTATHADMRGAAEEYAYNPDSPRASNSRDSWVDPEAAFIAGANWFARTVPQGDKS